jgi:hypothetical protein
MMAVESRLPLKVNNHPQNPQKREALMMKEASISISP